MTKQNIPKAYLPEEFFFQCHHLSPYQTFQNQHHSQEEGNSKSCYQYVNAYFDIVIVDLNIDLQHSVPHTFAIFL